MFHELYQHLPQYVHPIAFSIGSFSVRWYSLSYILGFLVVYFLLNWRIHHEPMQVAQMLHAAAKPISHFKIHISNLVMDFLLVSFFAALIGGRMGYVLFYNLPYYWAHPGEIFWPIDADGNFTGILGMSYHGAFVAILLSSWLFVKTKKIHFWTWADFVAPAAAAGYFFGRIGNFFNGELFGRVTTSQWGMYFPADPQNLRFPSELMEAFFEGLVLFLLLWKLRSKKNTPGLSFVGYVGGYACFRFVLEYFREPDPQLGLLWASITMGQLLSLGMFLLAMVFWFQKKQKNGILKK